MEEIVVVMSMERATKNKVLYKAQGEDVVIDNVYISKDAFSGSEPPDVVTVKIEAGS